MFFYKKLVKEKEELVKENENLVGKNEILVSKNEILIRENEMLKKAIEWEKNYSNDLLKQLLKYIHEYSALGSSMLKEKIEDFEKGVQEFKEQRREGK